MQGKALRATLLRLFSFTEGIAISGQRIRARVDVFLLEVRT